MPTKLSVCFVELALPSVSCVEQLFSLCVTMDTHHDHTHTHTHLFFVLFKKKKSEAPKV